MELDILAGLVAFSFVSSMTPGPNTLMLMASGANFGFRRTVPHMLGIILGFMLMVFLVGLGLVQLFDRYPVIHSVLKIASVLYMVWLAWKIAHSASPDAGSAHSKPMTFMQAAAFQWVNPKSWAIALTAVSIYSDDDQLLSVGIVALVFGLINGPSASFWTVLGIQVKRYLTNPRRLRNFNWTMAILLVLSLFPVLNA